MIQLVLPFPGNPCSQCLGELVRLCPNARTIAFQRYDSYSFTWTTENDNLRWWWQCSCCGYMHLEDSREKLASDHA